MTTTEPAEMLNISTASRDELVAAIEELTDAVTELQLEVGALLTNERVIRAVLGPAPIE